jgi:acyl dehydratase
MSAVQPYSVVAFNTATASTNKIHDDAVASALGFRGGLVPGVDVYAYLTQAPVREWGRAWLERGRITARFHQPVYDGDVVSVASDPDGGDGALVLTDPGGAVCARAVVSMPAGPTDLPDRPDPQAWADVAPTTDPPVASPEALAPGTALALAPHRFHAARAGEYLDAVLEVHPLYRVEGIAHPGWLLRDANYVLSSNVRLGPWIHVESTVQHHGLVRDGDEVSARATVAGEWEHKGHRFVRLDVVHLAGGRPVARTDHTAIYRPRGT